MNIMKTISNEERNLWKAYVFDMDIPDNRKECTEANLRWFMRNGAIRNMDHFLIQDALALVREVLRD